MGIGLIALSGWFDRASTTVVSLDSAEQILLVNDAGPVRVRGIDDDVDTEPGAVLAHSDSWLVSGPTVEVASSAGGANVVIRITCQTRFPCRSSAELVLPDGVDVVAVATEGIMQAGRFDGSMTLYSSGDGVSLGPLAGSVRVVSNGPIVGHALTAKQMNVLVSDGQVDLDFFRSPASLTIDGSDEPVNLVVPNQRFDIEVVTPDTTSIDVRTSDTSDRVIVIRSQGPVDVRNPE